MKQTIYILTFVLALWSCNNSTKEHYDNRSKDPLDGVVHKVTEKVLLPQKKQSPINNIKTTKDSTVYFSDSLFTNIELELKEISKNIFQSHEKNYEPACSLDSNGFINGKGLILRHHCKEICESYLIDQKQGINLALPSDYDAGIIGLLFSTSCDQFIIYSSYDSPDYSEYYEHRAEIFGFNITQGQGFDIIKPSFKYYTKDWSIEDITWVDENTLALKLYYEARAGTHDNLKFNYFITTLKTK